LNKKAEERKEHIVKTIEVSIKKWVDRRNSENP
jgi:hypothetical protein